MQDEDMNATFTETLLGLSERTALQPIKELCADVLSLV